MKNLLQSQEANKELANRELARRGLLHFISYNFPDYQTSWHHKVLANKLEAVANGEIKKLAVFMPPRHGKSEQCSIQFPAWILGKKPKTKIIMASYSEELATDFGRKTRNLVNTQEYKNVFNIALANDSKSAGRWNTDAGGYYVATGIGGAATGKGADVLIIDDPHKNRKEADSPVKRKEVIEWYRSTAKTRLSPEGAVILILTRWHDADLAGSILDDSWDIVEFKAIAEEDDMYRKKGEALWQQKYSIDWLTQQKKDIGSFEFSSLYQQTPLDLEHAEFKRDKFKYITRESLNKKHTQAFLTIDTAVSKNASADYTGMIDNFVDSQQNWHISATKKKIDASELVNILFDKHKVNNYLQIGIEDTILYQAIYPFLQQEQIKRQVFLPIFPLKHNQVAKEIRIRGLLPRYEAGVIYHIEGECEDLESELIRFPKSTHDDLSDALAYQNQLVQRVVEPAPYYQTYVDDMRLDKRTGYLQ
jgi:hypothetical protein